MKPSSNWLFPCLLFPLTGCAQSVSEPLQYLAQQPPSLTPEIFAPGFISQKDEYEFGSVFNRNATAFFYGVDVGGSTEIRFTELKGDEWSTPKTILSHSDYGFNDPFLSPDEQRLYFISQRALDGNGAKQDHDIWYIEKRINTWSAPFNAGPNINTGSEEYYVSFTQDGTMYFSSNKASPGTDRNDFDIYSSPYVDGAFQPAKRLGAAVNTPHYEADVFIAPDESYIIFCANRPEGLGRGDLYVSYKKDDGTWTKSINMGDKINSAGHELCPFVSKDGKYFFYTSDRDIYWVNAKILEEIRGTSK